MAESRRPFCCPTIVSPNVGCATDSFLVALLIHFEYSALSSKWRSHYCVGLHFILTGSHDNSQVQGRSSHSNLFIYNFVPMWTYTIQLLYLLPRIATSRLLHLNRVHRYIRYCGRHTTVPLSGQQVSTITGDAIISVNDTNYFNKADPLTFALFYYDLKHSKTGFFNILNNLFVRRW